MQLRKLKYVDTRLNIYKILVDVLKWDDVVSFSISILFRKVKLFNDQVIVVSYMFVYDSPLRLYLTCLIKLFILNI
jgi:hypothetical protein